MKKLFCILLVTVLVLTYGCSHDNDAANTALISEPAAPSDTADIENTRVPEEPDSIAALYEADSLYEVNAVPVHNTRVPIDLAYIGSNIDDVKKEWTLNQRGYFEYPNWYPSILSIDHNFDEQVKYINLTHGKEVVAFRNNTIIAYSENIAAYAGRINIYRFLSEIEPAYEDLLNYEPKQVHDKNGGDFLTWRAANGSIAIGVFKRMDDGDDWREWLIWSYLICAEKDFNATGGTEANDGNSDEQAQAPTEQGVSSQADYNYPTELFLIEGGAGHLVLFGGFYDDNGILYVEVETGTFQPIEDIYGWTYRVFDYTPEQIIVCTETGKTFTLAACYIEDYSQYCVASEGTDTWIPLSERFPEGYTVTKGAHSDSQDTPHSAQDIAPAFSPLGEWICIGQYDPYAWAEQVDFYQQIPQQYVSAVQDTLELRINDTELIQVLNGEEVLRFPWAADGQTINVTLPTDSTYYDYYLVDENTIHEFFADSAIYIYTRK